VLRPYVDRICDGAAAGIKIKGAKWIVRSQHVGDAVSVPGLHGSQCRMVVRPGDGIACAGVSLWIMCLERRLLPLTIRPLGPFPHGPLLPLDQRCQRARQLRQVALMCCRLDHDNTLNRNRGRCFEPDRGSRWLSSRPIWSAARLSEINTVVQVIVGR